MPGPKPPQIVLSQDERTALEQIVRAHSSGQALVRRARVVLLGAMGYSNIDIAREVPMDEEAVGLWRRRWHAWRGLPLEELSVADRLTDAPRPGAVPRLTAEQVCQIVALACELLPEIGFSSPRLPPTTVSLRASRLPASRSHSPGPLPIALQTARLLRPGGTTTCSGCCNNSAPSRRGLSQRPRRPELRASARRQGSPAADQCSAGKRTCHDESGAVPTGTHAATQEHRDARDAGDGY
jgi:hypothetical protein